MARSHARRSAQRGTGAISIRTGAAALFLTTTAPSLGHAQTIGPLIREPDDVPGRRVIPEYAPVGCEFAGFDILPSVMFGARVDDNVFTRITVKEADVSFVAEPRVRVRRQGRFESLALDASLRTSTYARLSQQDAIEYRLDATYTHGTTGSSPITVNLGHRREAIQRGTVENDLIGGEPLMRRVLHGSITGRTQFNRLSIDGQALVVRQHFENVDGGAGRVIDQRFRNVTHYGLHGVAAFEISGRTSVFGSLEYDRYDYARSPLLDNRDARNWSGSAGLRYDLSRVLHAQFGVGYRRYDFTDPRLGAIKGIAVSGHLRYFPTRLLAIRGVVEQSNTTSPYDLVGAVTLTTAKVEAEYEMRRSLSWLGAVKFTLEDYGKQDYSARRVDVSAGPRLRLNRWLSADASAGYARRMASGPAPFEPYSQFYAMVSITLAR